MTPKPSIVRAKAFKLHRFFEETESKYCKQPGDVAILCCRQGGSPRIYVTADGEFVLKLLRLMFPKKPK